MDNTKNIKSKVSAFALLTISAICIIYLATIFRSMKIEEPIYEGEGVTSKIMLSEYYSDLKETSGDTEIYVLEGEKPGASMLVLGGTHPNEPAGLMSAVMLIEQAKVSEGTLYIIPRTNNSAFTHTDPQEAAPMKFEIETGNGTRWFRFGSRATNPIDQWPDPEIYVHASSGQKLSGSETRNINRTYPGRTDGNFTEKVSYAITQLIIKEDISMTVDLHEASPEYPTINAIVGHERAMELTSLATLEMAMQGMEISIEPSPKNLHGLTHRELGDYTDTLATLMETANASQGRLRGKTDAELVVEGKDKYYEKAAKYGRLYVPWDENGHPLSERVARHITGIMSLATAYNDFGGESLVIENIPQYDDIIKNGLGAYLQSPK